MAHRTRTDVTSSVALSGLLTQIAQAKKQNEIYQRFVNLAVDNAPLPQGDGTIRISPFDDYILFTLYDEIDGNDTPIDFSNVGSIFISFIGENNEIKIPYHTNVEELDLSNGQVLFRISGEDGKKILALDNDNFYVSVQMISENGDTSDESVIYTGKFLSLTDEAQQSMTDKYNELLQKSIESSTAYEDQISTLNADLATANQKVTTLDDRVTLLFTSNQQLTNELADLSKDLTSQAITAALDAAAAAQAATNVTTTALSDIATNCNVSSLETNMI